MDFASFYGFKPILCRPYKPTTKGKVEKMVDYVKRNFYCGEKFTSVNDIILKSKEWMKKANNRIHATTKKIPFQLLKSENLLNFNKLYDTKIVYFRKVNKDIHFSFESNMYSVPYKFVGKEVSIIEGDNDEIQIFYRNKIIATHKLNLLDKGIFISIKEHIQELKDLKIKNNFKSYSNLKSKEKSKVQDMDMHLCNYDNVFTCEVETRDLACYGV
jgi:hypothetical protein